MECPITIPTSERGEGEASIQGSETMTMTLTLRRCRLNLGSALNRAISLAGRAGVSSAVDGAPLSNVLVSSVLQLQVLTQRRIPRHPTPSPGTGFRARPAALGPQRSSARSPRNALPSSGRWGEALHRAWVVDVSSSRPREPTRTSGAPGLPSPPVREKRSRDGEGTGRSCRWGQRREKLLPSSIIALPRHRSGWGWRSRCGPCTRWEWMGIRCAWGMG